MAEVVFIYEGKSINIQCSLNEKMEDICNSLSSKIKVDINLLIFLYGGSILNLEKKLNEITKENKITILVYKDEDEICTKCGRILNNKKIDEMISLNNNINNTIKGIKYQIENMIQNNTKSDINFMNSQLQNITIIINKINEDIKKINDDLNSMKYYETHNNIFKLNTKIEYINKENKNDLLNNEIVCIYNKTKYEIDLLHDYTDLKNWTIQGRKYYKEGRNNINGNNIEIYINDKKIEFNYKYKGNEKGEIKVKFKFNKLLTSTFCMFYGCFSLKSIDLSSFNTINVNDMGYMFYECCSLKTINLSSFNTINVNDMGYMFCGCSSLKSIDLSSFNTINVENMGYMFCRCLFIKSLDLSSFNTINVYYMRGMFSKCSSLKSIDLSSFSTTNTNDMFDLFDGCYSLRKENVKFNKSERKILTQLNNCLIKK